MSFPDQSFTGTDFLKNRVKSTEFQPLFESEPISEKNKGKQGIVNRGACLLNGEKKGSIIKISQAIDYCIRHEYNVMSGMSSLLDYCGHFCSSYGISETKVNEYHTTSGIIFSPFAGSNTYQTDVLWMEEIPSGISLADAIMQECISSDQLVSCIKQVVLALYIAQRDLQFTHYDLHTENVLLLPIEPNAQGVYIIENETLSFPLHGVFPVIIDFGFSYHNSQHPVYTSTDHTNRGYNPFRFDEFSDVQTFLINVVRDISEGGDKYDLPALVRAFQLFGKMDVDPELGWDDMEGPSLNQVVSEEIEDILEGKRNAPPDLLKHATFLVDLFSSLVSLPLEEKVGKHRVRTPFLLFLSEFERLPGRDRFTLLRQLLDITRKHKDAYLANGDTTVFRQDLEKKGCSIVKKHAEKLLCGAVCMGERIRKIYASEIGKVVSFRAKQKKILNDHGIHHILDFYFMFEDKNAPEVTIGQPLYLWDTLQKKSKILQVSESNLPMLKDKRYGELCD